MQNEVYISNISEDVWSFIQSMTPEERAFEIEENANLADRDIFTLPVTQRSIFIAPKPLDPAFLAYYHALFPQAQVEVLTPTQHTGEICLDVLADTTIMQRLLDMSERGTLILKSYSSSAQFQTLAATLRHAGGRVLTPESPSQDHSWTVNFFGSKSGIRQVATHLAPKAEHWMAPGYIVQGIQDVASLAASIYCSVKAVVLKTNKAHAGVGVKLFRPGDLPTNYEACYQALTEFLATQRYWQEFPVVIEAFLQIDTKIGGGNPNCEYWINHQGQLELLYSCGMRVSKNGVFKGIEIHQSVLPPEILEPLEAYGRELGTMYTKAGYRGYFDVDCVYTKQGQLLITESNVRRTGGTHVYHTAKNIIGPNFLSQSYILSNNSLPLTRKKTLTFTQVHQTLTPLLFNAETGEGLILASSNILQQHNLSYIIFGRNKKAALQIEKQMENLLH